MAFVIMQVNYFALLRWQFIDGALESVQSHILFLAEAYGNLGNYFQLSSARFCR